MTIANVSAFNLPRVCWGRHSLLKEITEFFNDFFGLKLTDKAWASRFADTLKDLTAITVQNSVVDCIQQAVVSSILLSTATGTIRDDLTKTRQFRQLIDPEPLYIGCTVLGSAHACLKDKAAFEHFLESMEYKGEYSRLFIELGIQLLYLRPNLFEVNYLNGSTGIF